ncbi:ankyrin repeat domain-containing protein [Actinoplanes utahensis]|uniref:Uncharacterized protein n=1 Tax=Actinoplanes utahensis TaxID=1869 RepID=A0A0A6XBC5_ACTUT|nr:ankyrin repeat domain-containing protein [Actinoplanes utahensis]KHD77382.1 hypothetical protein MB27_11585 [Actinoplanes utahensis]GIF32861.1 hypothetical protein Aut01nite_58470 [Actinoplanes utahensis]
MIRDRPWRSLHDWKRIRRYAVPTWMIEECAAARERGDWRAACEAAVIDVAIDADGPVADLLAGFAPDLLRWHLPRALDGSTTLDRGRRYLLAPDGPVEPDTAVLVARTPGTIPSDRLTLEAIRAGDLGEGPIHPVPSYLWDARRAGDLRAAANGSEARVPGFTPGGEPLPAELLGVGDDGPALAERILVAPGAAEAWETAGWTAVQRTSLAAYQLPYGVDPLLLAHEVRRLAVQFRRRVWAIAAAGIERTMHLVTDGGHPEVAPFSADAELAGWCRASLRLHPHFVSRPIDLTLVADQRVDPRDLHPLVRAALFPGPPAASAVPPASAVAPVPAPDGGRPARSAVVTGSSRRANVVAELVAERVVRVRCRAVWHPVTVRAGRIETPEHPPEEQRREQALGAFGGQVGGCFQARSAWLGGTGHLPKRLRHHRSDLFQQLRHGGAGLLHELLDAGLDPFLRDGLGRTFLHLLGELGDARLLPRLLAAGLDVNARDKLGVTPLYEAVFPLHRHWPVELIIALLDAGADPGLPVRESSALHYLRSQEHTEDPGIQKLIDYLRECA